MCNKTALRLIVVATLVFVVALASNVLGAVRYNVARLDIPVNTYFAPTGINNAGVIVGQFYSQDNGGTWQQQVGVWQNNALTNLGTLGRTNASASGINASGQVSGNTQQISGSYHYNEAFTLQVGAPPTFMGMLNLTGMAGEGAHVMDINDAGQMVGTYTDGTYNGGLIFRGFIWENGTATDIGVPSGTYNRVFCRGINSAGTVIGLADKDSSVTEVTAYVWTKTNGFQVVPNALGNGRILPADIDDSGRMVGYYETEVFGTPGCQTRPFYYVGSSMVALPIPPGLSETDALYATQINSRGQIVGYGGNNQPFLWEDGNVYEINDLVPPGFGPFGGLVRINDVGQIAIGKSVPGGTEAYLLTPIPEPPTFVLGISVLFLLGWAARKKSFFGIKP